MGVLLTMYDGRNNAAKTIRGNRDLRRRNGLPYDYPRNTTLNKAVMSNPCGSDYDDGCSSCRSHRELAQEMEAALIQERMIIQRWA